MPTNQPTLSKTSITPPPSSRALRAPLKTRPKTYGGDLTPAALELVLGFEERIAHIESRHTRISVELEATREALFTEREERSRNSSISSYSQQSAPLDGQIVHTNLNYQRKRDDLLNSLKTLRGQNALLSRSLREKEDSYASLKADLEAERAARIAAEEEVGSLSSINFTLLEHNKLLFGRDSALQEDISSLITKSQADDWMRGVLEEELRHSRGASPAVNAADAKLPSPRPTLGITLEHQGTLRAQLVSTRDELHISQQRLAESEKQCTLLNERVTSLQQQVNLCVDSSAHALEMERELRAEIEGHVQELMDENSLLKNQKAPTDEALIVGKPLVDALEKKVGQHRITDSISSAVEGRASRKENSGTTQTRLRPLSSMPLLVLKTDMKRRMEDRERLLDRHLRHLAFKVCLWCMPAVSSFGYLGSLPTNVEASGDKKKAPSNGAVSSSR